MAQNNVYLVVHTMTIADCRFVIKAEFYHAVFDDLRVEDARLIGRRVSLRVHPRLRGGRGKLQLQKLDVPNLRMLMKRNAAVVKHDLRTIHIGQEAPKPRVNSPIEIASQSMNASKIALAITPPSPTESKEECSNPEIAIEQTPNNDQLSQYATPEETVQWLINNRFDKYLDTFSRFSGSDMLRLSRNDLMEICGQANGIRLHNILHLKAKLKIYVCHENSSVFNAIFLTSYNHMQLLQKLCALINASSDQVKSIYVEGPDSIHIQLNDDLLQHIEEETMFTLNVMQEKGNYILLLKRRTKK